MAIFESPRVVRLLEEAPELLDGIELDDERQAVEHSLARVGTVGPGPWRPAGARREPDAFGLFVLDGLLVRSVSIGDRTCAEVLGPGDVLRPWVRAQSGSGSIESEVAWTAVEQTSMAVLDGAFLRRMAAWPEVIAALGDRVMLRTHWLAFHLAVCHMRRIDERLLIVLWHFADRWGHVTPSGTVLPIPLTHSLLAKIVGGQRPSVSSALGDLQRDGVVSRTEDRAWVLHGEPPHHLSELRYRPTGSGRIEPEEIED